MKLSTMIAAGLVAVAAIAPAAASAQMQEHHERHDKVVRTTTVRTDDGRPDARSDRRGVRERHHTRRVCKMKWRDHHRVRVCRTVRW